MAIHLLTRIVGCGVLAFALNTVVVLAIHGQGLSDTLAMQGDPAPDGDGDFFVLQLPKLNDDGQVAFGAHIGTSFTDEGVFDAPPELSGYPLGGNAHLGGLHAGDG